MISTARKFFGLLRNSRRLLVLSTVLSLAQAALVVPIGLLFERTFDDTIPDHKTGALIATGGVIVVLALGSAALSLWTRYLVLSATKTAVMELRLDLLERIQSLPAAWADRNETGRLHATVVQDTERIDQMSNAMAAQFVPSSIVGAGLGIALIVVSPLLVLLLVPVVLIMLFLTRWLGELLRTRTRKWHVAFDKFSIRTHFALRARSLVASAGTEKAEIIAAQEELQVLRDTSRSMTWMQNAYVQANAVAAMLTAVIVLVVGGVQVASGDLTIGALVAFFALAAMLRGPLNTIVAVVPDVIAGGESLIRLEAILHAEESEPYHGTTPPDGVLPLTLRDIQFGYRESEPVLRGTSIEINPGELVAIVGSNGAGKSTVAALILGLYRPDRGELLADGAPYDDIDVKALRRRIAIVPEDPVIFPGTIAENIAYGDPGADPERVVEAARRATADDFIGRLRAGYETPVGDEGELLSSGQRQRIAIARALMRDPELLILDEPTTSLDRKSVASLLAELTQFPGEGAILVISHDPVVVAGAERVLELSAGVAKEPVS